MQPYKTQSYAHTPLYPHAHAPIHACTHTPEEAGRVREHNAVDRVGFEIRCIGRGSVVQTTLQILRRKPLGRGEGTGCIPLG